jgi:hypothetical protein
VQLGDAESLRVHNEHDLSVFVCRKREIMRPANASFRVTAGGVPFIPKVMAHAVKNRATAPVPAIAALTPAFDGNETLVAGE